MNRGLVHFEVQEGYARRPSAPRRRGHRPAQHDDGPGQLSLAEEHRRQRRRAAEHFHPCPACHAPRRSPCTRRPSWGEQGRQPLGYYCHPQRDVLVTDEEFSAAAGDLDAPDSSRLDVAG